MLPYLAQSFDVKMIKRSRKLLSKTISLAWRILTSNGDLYHVNYALQDAWLVQKLKTLDVLHVHGSDVRSITKTRTFGWMVRHNLRNAKVVLYSTPDLKEIVETHRRDAMYFHNPVDTDKFTRRRENTGHIRAIYFQKSYDTLPLELTRLLKEANIKLYVPKRRYKYSEMPKFYQQYDVFIDQSTGAARSKMCLEAMSCELATIDHNHFPDLEPHVAILANRTKGREIGRANRKYILKHHNAKNQAQKLLGIWQNVLD